MRPYRLIDADCHTLEPPHIWKTCMPAHFHDRAPQLAKDEDGGGAKFLVPSQRTMYHFIGNEDREFHRAGVPARERYDILAGNGVRIYQLPQTLEVPT